MEFEISFLWIPGAWQRDFVLSNFKIYFLGNQSEYRKSPTPFFSLLSAEWYNPVCWDVRGNAKAFSGGHPFLLTVTLIFIQISNDSCTLLCCWLVSYEKKLSNSELITISTSQWFEDYLETWYCFFFEHFRGTFLFFIIIFRLTTVLRYETSSQS